MIRLGWVHWIEVYKDDIVRYNEYYMLCRHLAMPFHVGAMDRFRMLPDEAKVAEVARLRRVADLAPGEVVPLPSNAAVPPAAEERDPIYYHIVIGEDGQPEEVEVEPGEDGLARPRL